MLLYAVGFSLLSESILSFIKDSSTGEETFIDFDIFVIIEFFNNIQNIIEFIE